MIADSISSFVIYHLNFDLEIPGAATNTIRLVTMQGYMLPNGLVNQAKIGARFDNKYRNGDAYFLGSTSFPNIPCNFYTNPSNLSFGFIFRHSYPLNEHDLCISVNYTTSQTEYEFEDGDFVKVMSSLAFPYNIVDLTLTLTSYNTASSLTANPYIILDKRSLC